MIYKVFFILTIYLFSLQPLNADMPKQFVLQKEIEILSADRFLCKAKDDPVINNAPLRVQINDVELVADPNVKIRAKEFIGRLFNKSKIIELQNVHYSPGFRLKADVMADGRLVYKILVEQGFAIDKSKSKIKQTETGDPNTIFLFQPSLPVNNYIPENNNNDNNKKPVAVSVSTLMQKEIDLRAITPDTPFSEAIDMLSQSIEPGIPIVILWRDLELNTLIQKDSPCGIGGLSKVRLGQALDLILRSSAGTGPRPVVVVEGGILTIGSETTFKKSKNKVYHVEDILHPPSSEYNNTGNNTQN